MRCVFQEKFINSLFHKVSICIYLICFCLYLYTYEYYAILVGNVGEDLEHQRALFL